MTEIIINLKKLVFWFLFFQKIKYLERKKENSERLNMSNFLKLFEKERIYDELMVLE